MTLRSAYFKDWGNGPTVLLWGDATGMQQLRDLLHKIHTDAPLMLSEFSEAVDGRKITVKLAASPSGMHLHDHGLEWNLSAQSVDDFAEMVGALAKTSKGHQYLDCGDGITVTVSLDEYPASLRP